MNDDNQKTTDEKQLTTDNSQPGADQEQAEEQAGGAEKPVKKAQAEAVVAGNQEDIPSEPSEPETSQKADTPSGESPGNANEEQAQIDLDKNSEVLAAEEKTPTEETKEEVEKGETDIKTSKKDPKGAHWYVVHTYSGHEAKVAATLKQRIESQRLADKILEILVPTQEKIEIREGKKSTVREKLFPGYILIKMILDDATWLAVRTTPGITSFVGNANKPTPLPESEVGTIQRFMTMEAPKFKAAFTVGEAVKITDGPFSDFLGSISEIDDEKGKVKVLVSIFGRETPVELDFLQIAKL